MRNIVSECWVFVARIKGKQTPYFHKDAAGSWCLYIAWNLTDLQSLTQKVKIVANELGIEVVILRYFVSEIHDIILPGVRHRLPKKKTLRKP